MESQAIALAVLGVDDKGNLNWNKCFDVSMEKDLKSLMNEATYL